MSIIGKYNDIDIKEFLRTAYGLNVDTLKPTKRGLDNTTIIAKCLQGQYPCFVIKIYETKKEKDVLRMLRKLPLVSEFNEATIIEDSARKSVATFKSKPTICFKYIHGVTFKIDNMESMSAGIELLSKIHLSRSRNTTKPEKLKMDFLQDFYLYSNRTTLSGIHENFPDDADNVIHICQEVRRGLEGLTLIPTGIGLTHNDFSCDNLIETPKGLAVIDWDNVEEDGSQLNDLLQLVFRSGISQTPEAIEKAFEQYFFLTKDQKRLTRTQKIGIRSWALLFSLKLVLSTHHYTYKIRKHSPDWVKHNAGDYFKRLHGNLNFWRHYDAR